MGRSMPIIPFPDHPVVALRKCLLANGLQPVAVYTKDKRPFGAGWQVRRGMPPFVPTALSTGILCRNVRAVDIDIDDADLAARAVEIVQTIFGPTPFHRTRPDSPRRLLLYLGAGSKKTIKIPSDAGKIEILGAGNQFVSHGLHPGGAAYEWLIADPATYDFTGGHRST